jgi:exopolyphosphatase/guanosine-5'-triphosphate,3'-diphosphate pyrophosphatase
MKTVAVIDIGSNSTNLLVQDANGNEITRIITSTRLGEMLHQNGTLSSEAITRTFETVQAYVALAQSHGAESVHLFGTAACRRASNTSEFIRLLRDTTGYTLEVLSEKDEASLTFSGAITGMPEVLGPNVVIDIGGASTEYTVGVMSADQSASIPFGALTSTASHIRTDPPKPEDLTNLIGAVSDELEEISRSIPALLTPSRVVGVAGTIVTIAAVELGLAEFNAEELHGFVLSRDAAEDVFRTMATEPLAQRTSNPGLSAHRADIIVAGCCILVATMRRLHLNEITVSTRGLLDGVANRARLHA